MFRDDTLFDVGMAMDLYYNHPVRARLLRRPLLPLFRPVPLQE